MGEPDFSGYATKAGLLCSDGRTITAEAFKHQDKMSVPLVWQHKHNEPDNVLGHAILEARDDGIYAYGYFNGTPQGKTARALVEHKDVSFLSIWANQLVEKGKQVLHGAIREVSLVLAGANPGATIDFVAIRHSDGEIEQFDDEAVITTGLELQHEDNSDKTLQEIYESFTDEQKEVVAHMVAAALESTGEAEHSATDEDGDDDEDDPDKNEDP